MAVVKGPAMSLDASGNLGPVCYAKWRGLNIARDPWTGTVPNTTKQVVIQGYMTTVSKLWSGTLTADQRAAWDEIAKGQIRISRVKTTYVPTGYQYFVQLNMQATRQGYGPWLDTPPILPPFGFKNLFIAWFSGTDWIYFRTAGHLVSPPGGYQAEYWVAGPYDGGGRHARDQEYKFFYYYPLGVNRNYPATVHGKWYWVRGRWVDKFGRVGNWHVKQVYAGVI